jgi:hypothetical protein
MPHQLVDHPGGDGGVLQPGSEGVPQVMRAAQVEMGKVGSSRLDRGLVDPPQIGGRQRRPSAAGDAVAATGPGEDQTERNLRDGILASNLESNRLPHLHTVWQSACGG